MKKTNKKLGMIVSAVGLVFVMSLFVSAFGVSTSYWDDKPLKLSPGESKIISLGLQNGVGNEDITLEAELSDDGGGIATFIDSDLNYFIPLGGGVGVPIRIELPEDAEKGVTHTIVVSFTQISTGAGGMVRLTGGIVTKFPVEVVGEKESELYTPPEVKKGLSGFWMIVIALAVALTIFLIVKSRKD